MIDLPVELQVGSRGQFDVLVDGDVVVTKDKVGFFARIRGDKGFPDEDRAVAAVKARVDRASPR